VHISNLKKRYPWDSPEHSGSGKYHTKTGKRTSNIIKRSDSGMKEDSGNFSAMNHQKME
jgi:hypothetical protein